MKRTLVAGVLGLLAIGSVMAQTYPSKPIRFIVPFTAGSGTDIIARTIGDAMSKSMGQPILIENKPGAGGTIAAGPVAKGEAGVPGSDYTFWVGMIVASATPAPVVKRLHEEALKAMANPDVKERMKNLGADPYPMSVEAFNAFIRQEVESAARIAKAGNLKGQ